MQTIRSSTDLETPNVIEKIYLKPIKMIRLKMKKGKTINHGELKKKSHIINFIHLKQNNYVRKWLYSLGLFNMTNK